MGQRLTSLLSWVFFVCKWTGFTSYCLVNDPGNKNKQKIFKRTTTSIFMNIVIILLLILSLDVRIFLEGLGTTVSNFSVFIAIFVDVLNSIVLVLLMNLKQTRVVNVFYRLVAFGEMQEEIIRRKILESKLKRSLQIYTLVVYNSQVVMLAILQ